MAAQNLLACAVRKTGIFPTSRSLALQANCRTPFWTTTALWARLLAGGANCLTMGQSGVWRADDGWQMEASESKKKAIRWEKAGGSRGPEPLLPEGLKSRMMSPWLSILICTESGFKLGWCHAPLPVMVHISPWGVEGLYGSSEQGNCRQAPLEAPRLIDCRVRPGHFRPSWPSTTDQTTELACCTLIEFCVVNKNQCRQGVNQSSSHIFLFSFFQPNSTDV